jgi:dTDP-4-dehydrorhamnose 3,5-epimerase
MRQAARIDGVVVTHLKVVRNERGRLMEVQRADDRAFPGFGQACVTATFPGVVKAWYRHSTQIDQLAVVSGELRLALYDPRDGSPTRGAVAELRLGDEQPLLVLIPPGVWHGFQAVGDREALILHLNTAAYDVDAPDEERLDPDTETIPYRW